MCFKKLDNPNRTDGSAKKTEAVKDWILFFGELVKASVDGVVEFWGEDKKEAETVVQPVVTPEADVIDLCEELNEEVELEETAEKVEEAVSGPTAKELKQQVKALRRAQKLARKEEKKALKVEKRGEKLLRKQEKQERDQDKKQKKNEHKAEKQQKKDQKKAGYIPKNMILSETEKKFYDGIRSAVGLRYVVKARVAMADVLKRGDGTKCKGESLGEMDFGVFDLQNRLKVLIEIRGLKRKGHQSQKAYRKVRKLCKKAGIPVVTFWVKYGVLTGYIKERMQDYLNVL